jgi:hypothetical protein
VPFQVGRAAHELNTSLGVRTTDLRNDPGPHPRTPAIRRREQDMGSVIKKRRKRMAKKKHRKLLKKTRIQRRNKK